MTQIASSLTIFPVPGDLSSHLLDWQSLVVQQAQAEARSPPVATLSTS